ncbi:hypothetical protein M0R45_016679 [Rubus argutus]|uniref:Uncharacterized protein n=1 Tax=Rubus argutus TaxID=59490 RepID=A0AAW1XUP5_RUBAR
MAAENSSKVCEAHPMTGGDGPYSYAKNSTLQRDGLDVSKELVRKAIAEKLDVEILPSNTFRIADLGCSVGPNTFLAVENILEGVEFKYQSQGMNSQIPEFHVFFNDHTSNDFNMLFKTLPQNRRYYAAGVPGSFYGRLFPDASIHLAHSSYAIHWLFRVPKAVVDSKSPAWNKGRIHYSNSTDEVIRAYETQYTEDMECFLQDRAKEIVYGGLMVLTFPVRPDGTPHSDSSTNVMAQLLGSSLMDLVRKGVVKEEKVDSFNVPVYTMSPQEFAAVVEQNGCFSMEIMVGLPSTLVHDPILIAQVVASTIRAGMGEDLKHQFGEEVLDELFDLFRKKCEEHTSALDPGKGVILLVVLRRKAD